MGDDPRPLRLSTSDERALVPCLVVRQRTAQLGLFEEDRVVGASEDAPFGQPAPDLEGAVAQERAGLVVEPEDVVLPLPVGPLCIGQCAFETSQVLFAAPGPLGTRSGQCIVLRLHSSRARGAVLCLFGQQPDHDFGALEQGGIARVVAHRSMAVALEVLLKRCCSPGGSSAQARE